MQQIAAHFFRSEETEEIMALPPSERDRAFFCCWTRKEAYVKAIGDGLSAPLDGFRVTVLPNTPAQFARLRNSAIDTDAWTLHDLSLTPSYAAAVAYRDRRRPLSIFPVTDLAQLFSTM
jgi:4'-phosphopantetheinyl transferase